MCGRLLVGKGFLARMQPWSTCNLRHALVAGIRDNSKRLFNTLPSHRGYDSELGHVGADGIDHRALLANEELAGAMQRQAALLLGRLGLDKPIARASLSRSNIRNRSVAIAPVLQKTSRAASIAPAFLAVSSKRGNVATKSRRGVSAKNWPKVPFHSI